MTHQMQLLVREIELRSLFVLNLPLVMTPSVACMAEDSLYVQHTAAQDRPPSGSLLRSPLPALVTPLLIHGESAWHLVMPCVADAVEDGEGVFGEDNEGGNTHAAVACVEVDTCMAEDFLLDHQVEADDPDRAAEDMDILRRVSADIGSLDEEVDDEGTQGVHDDPPWPDCKGRSATAKEESAAEKAMYPSTASFEPAGEQLGSISNCRRSGRANIGNE